MMTKPHSKLFISLILVTIVAISFATNSLAQVRGMDLYTMQDLGDSIDPDAPPDISPDSLCSICFGVSSEGTTKFFVDEGGTSTEILASSLKLIMRDQRVLLEFNGSYYHYPIHQGSACSIAQFTSRQGQILYTVPFYFDDQSTQKAANAGLQKIGESLPDVVLLEDSSQFPLNGDWVAREFAGTDLVSVIAMMDFAMSRPLDEGLKETLLDGLQAPDQVSGETRYGYYFWSDKQIRYKAYLTEDGTVEVANLPLKYHRDFSSDGWQIVNDIEAFDLQFDQYQVSSNFVASDGVVTVSQFDVLVMYQALALFRTVWNADKSKFASFEEDACG